jgi:hypothetical protein
MTSEEHILLLLDHLRDGKAKKPASLRYPSSEEEWSAWIDCAIDQGVAPLLYYRVKLAKIERSFPGHMLVRLEKSYHENAARNLRLFHELKKALSALTVNHIPVIVLKGAFLASTVYTNPALRSMSDLDILIHFADIPAALEKLNELGYQPMYSPWQATDYDQILVAPDGMTLLEVHWSLANQYTLYNSFIEDLWRRAKPQIISGRNVLTLAPEDLLVHLCQHTAVHHLFLQGIRPLCDVDTIIRKYKKMDWRALSQRALHAGLSKAVSLTLYLSWRHLETPIPDMVIRSLQLEEFDPGIAQEAMKQMSIAPKAQDPLPYLVVEILGERKLIEKAKITLGNVFRPSWVALLSQPNRWWLRRIYFQFRRVIYLIGRYAGILLQFLRGDPETVLQIKPQIVLQNWLREEE